MKKKKKNGEIPSPLGSSENLKHSSQEVGARSLGQTLIFPAHRSFLLSLLAALVQWCGTVRILTYGTAQRVCTSFCDRPERVVGNVLSKTDSKTRPSSFCFLEPIQPDSLGRFQSSPLTPVNSNGRACGFREMNRIHYKNPQDVGDLTWYKKDKSPFVEQLSSSGIDDR